MNSPAERTRTFLHRANSPIEIPEAATILPGPGRVLVRIARDTEGKYGPLIIPASIGERKFFGRVEGTCPFFTDEGNEDEIPDESWLKPGDLVFFGKFAGTELQINRESFVICRETDILAVVRDANDEVVLTDPTRGG